MKPSTTAAATVRSCGQLLSGSFMKAIRRRPFFVGSQAASLTHGNPKAFLSTATISAIIASLAVGKDISTALGGALHILQRDPEGRVFKIAPAIY